ncbi:MAG TPA: allophanate hydrolase subunit 1 [Jatrophihabitantaceae bacterium]|jgi:KipI family sensor histidine kinase inhibitor|nr:allophanate hydrolase subunit 1 [Jatrophihabitantaceae bacterium]
MKFLPYGDTGVLVEAEEAIDVLALRAVALSVPGVVDAVPAARTLLVEFDPRRTSARHLAALLEVGDPNAAAAPVPDEITMRVRYDGADLEEVAAETRLSAAEVVERHCDATYLVAFGGFAPGFAYLTGLDPRLRVARLDRPRTSVPGGAVAIAGEYTGIYPRPSPGGWRLLGTVDATVWDTDRQPPALLQPGMRVRFVAT